MPTSKTVLQVVLQFSVLPMAAKKTDSRAAEIAAKAVMAANAIPTHSTAILAEEIATLAVEIATSVEIETAENLNHTARAVTVSAHSTNVEEVAKAKVDVADVPMVQISEINSDLQESAVPRVIAIN